MLNIEKVASTTKFEWSRKRALLIYLNRSRKRPDNTNSHSLHAAGSGYVPGVGAYLTKRNDHLDRTINPSAAD